MNDELAERVKLLEQRLNQIEPFVQLNGPGGKGGFIRAREMQLVDEEGRVRIELSAASNESWIVLRDGESNVMLRLKKDGPEFVLGTKAVRSLVAKLDQDGRPHIEFADAEKRMVRADLGLGPAGPILNFYDTDGWCRWAGGVLEDGSPALAFFASGEYRHKLTLSASATVTGLALHDDDGTERLKFTVDDDGRPVLRLLDSVGQDRVVLSAGGENNGLKVYDSHDVLRMIIGVNADEIPWFVMNDELTVPRIKMTILPDGTSGVFVDQRNGQTVVSMASASTTHGFSVFDTTGGSRILLGMAGSEAGLVILNEDGQRTVNLP